MSNNDGQIAASEELFHDHLNEKHFVDILLQAKYNFRPRRSDRIILDNRDKDTEEYLSDLFRPLNQTKKRHTGLKITDIVKEHDMMRNLQAQIVESQKRTETMIRERGKHEFFRPGWRQWLSHLLFL